MRVGGVAGVASARAARVARSLGGVLVAIAAASAAACATASGDVSGGAVTYDAASPAPVVVDGGDAGEAGTDDGGDVCTVDALPGAATTWTGLYTDYFGPTGKASCSKEGGSCHGGASEPGAVSSGFTCADKDGCYASLRSSNLVADADVSAPASSNLVGILRHTGSTGSVIGIMPKRPGCATFTAAAITRISGWISAGAKND